MALARHFIAWRARNFDWFSRCDAAIVWVRRHLGPMYLVFTRKSSKSIYRVFITNASSFSISIFKNLSWARLFVICWFFRTLQYYVPSHTAAKNFMKWWNKVFNRILTRRFCYQNLKKNEESRRNSERFLQKNEKWLNASTTIAVINT